MSASKEYKEKFLLKWNDVLEKLSNNSEYVAISGIMTDVEVLVVGEKNVIFLAQYHSLLERLLNHIKLIEKLLLEVFNIDYKVVFLLNDEWEFEKNRYISNLKSNYKYEYIEENENDSYIQKDDDIEKVISILGNDVIKYE